MRRGAVRAGRKTLVENDDGVRDRDAAIYDLEPEPELQLESEGPKKPSHIVLRERREAALNAFYKKYPTQGKTPAEIRTLVANNGVPATPTNRFLVLGSVAVRKSIGSGQPIFGNRLELGDIVVARDVQKMGDEEWVAVDRGGSQLGWAPLRLSTTEDLADDAADAAHQSRQTTANRTRKTDAVTSARWNVKQRQQETTEHELGRLLLEKIPDGLFDTLPRRYKNVTAGALALRSGAAEGHSVVEAPNELQAGAEILGLERRIVFSDLSRPRLEGARALIRFEHMDQTDSWVDEGSLQLMPPAANWYDELCDQLTQIEGNTTHESPDHVLASKKKPVSAAEPKLWDKYSAKKFTAANEELQRRKCCCIRTGRHQGIEELAAANAANSKASAKGFCNPCLEGCLPAFRRRLRDSLQTLVEGGPNWPGTGSGAGMLAFLSSPFLFQAVCCTVIYAVGPESILTVVSIFMFVNVCCLLPAELKFRSLHKNGKYKTEDGDIDPLAEMDNCQRRAYQDEQRVAQERATDASVGRIWGSVWIYTALLMLVPASLVVSTAHTGEAAALGIVIYVVLLWCIGWVYMWFHSDALEAIKPDQRLNSMPPDPVIRMKMVTVMLECYNYMGFSFFPAVPWSSMKVPDSVPHPQKVMMIGFFQFGDISLHKITFWISCGMILLAFFAFHKTRNDVAKNLVVIQFFFEMAAFPIIKKMTGALTCTSMFKWAFTRNGALRSCQLEQYDYVEPGSQCMDEAPNVLCWDNEHLLLYVAPVMIFLAPYYIACIDFQSSSQAKQSIVIIDRVCGIVSFQFKFILAFIASAMGDCYPWIMVGSIEVSVVFQLILTTYDRDYTSVLSLNAVRVAGLAMASINGLYASFVVYHFGDTPGSSTGACVESETAPNFTALADSSADDSCVYLGQAMGLNGVCDVDSGACSDRTDCTDCQTCEDSLVQSYAIFFGLLVVNVVALLLAFCWYMKKLDGWEASDLIKRGSSDVLQVDYPILKRRLEMVRDKLSDSHGTNSAWSSYDRFKLGFDRGLLYAQVQAVWEWADKDGRGTLDFSELCILCKTLQVSNQLPYLIDIDRIKNTFNLDTHVPNQNVKVTEAHFFAVLERARRNDAVDTRKQKFCKSAQSRGCICYSAAGPGSKRGVPLGIPLREHREQYGICEACEVRYWFYALKHSKGLMPSSIPANSSREKKLVELLSNEVEKSIQEARSNSAPEVEGAADEANHVARVVKTVENAARASSKLGLFGGSARVTPVHVTPLGAINANPPTPAKNPKGIVGETPTLKEKASAATTIQSKFRGYRARSMKHQEKHVQDAVMKLENRKDFQTGLRHGLNWLDVDADWSVNDSKEPISYWKETASEQAWSKSKNFLVFVSEYSSVQDALVLQRSEYASHEAARLNATHDSNGDAGEVDDETDEQSTSGILHRAGSQILDRAGSFVDSATSLKHKGLVRVGSNMISGAVHLVQDGTKMASSAAHEASRIGFKQLDRTLSAAKTGVTHLHSHGLSSAMKTTSYGLADKGMHKVNMISRLAGFAKDLGDETLVTANRANGQQIEGASLKMVLQARGERKLRAAGIQNSRERLTSRMRRDSLEAIERVRRTSIEAFQSLTVFADDQRRPPDPHTQFWRVRLDIRDVDLSTAGGLLLMKTLKKMHGHIKLTLSKGCKAKLKTVGRAKHLDAAIIEKLRIKRMVGDDLKNYAAVIFSPFLRVESVDLQGVEMRRHFQVLVESLPNSGIRTLNLSYCGITQAFMRSFVEKLVLQATNGSPAAATEMQKEMQSDVPNAEESAEISHERSCCSLCFIDDATAPSRQWLVETGESGQFESIPRAKCKEIEEEIEKLSRWHPPLECMKWTTSIDVDGLDTASGNVHCIELAGWSDKGVETAKLARRIIVGIASVHADIGGNAESPGGPWSSMYEASKATSIDCNEIFQRCNAHSTREIARDIESFESNEWYRTIYDTPNVEYSNREFDKQSSYTSIEPQSNLNGITTHSSELEPKLVHRKESEHSCYVQGIPGVQGKCAFYTEELEDGDDVILARRVKWKEHKRHVAKPLAFVHEAEWRWTDVRRKVGTIMWERKATRAALLTDSMALLKGRKNMQRPLMLRWQGPNGSLVEKTFKNRRELAMEWPDQKSHHRVCAYCGLSISPSMSLLDKFAQNDRNKTAAEKETWPADKIRTKWKLGRNIESLTSLDIVGNPLGNSCQDMIHILQDSPSLQTLCGLNKSQTIVDWRPTNQDPRRKTLEDCMLLAADIKVARAAAKVHTINLSQNPLFPRLKDYEHSETGKESDDDILIDQEKMQWMYVCKILRDSSDRLAHGVRKFQAYDTGLHGPVAQILVEHGLRTEKKLVPDPTNPGKMIAHEGLSVLNLELNPLGLEGGAAVADLMTDADVRLKKVVVGGLISGERPAVIDVHNSKCERLELSGAFLEPGEILIVAAAIPTLLNLQYLSIGEEKTEDDETPHAKYELDVEWDRLDFTAEKYSNMLTADFLLIGAWIGKENVSDKLKRLSIRSTGLRGRRSKGGDKCFQSNICTGPNGDKNCPSCRLREFVKTAETQDSGFPSCPEEQVLDPYCYTLDVDQTELNLSDKFLGAADCKLIAAWLDNICTKYTKLKLDKNLLTGSLPHKWDKIDVDVSGIEALGSVIHKLENLQEIDLSGNLLGSNALLAFAAPVEGGSPLSGGLSVRQGVFRVLDISDNRIDAEGWRDFLILCSQGDIPIKHMGNGVSVIAKRNPILWTISASRPVERSTVGIFPMRPFREKTYAKVANIPDVNLDTRIRNQAVSLRKIVADDESDAVTAGERESNKTDELPFKISLGGGDVHFAEQALVTVTGSPSQWLNIWEESCDYLSKTRFSGLDISDCGMSSLDPRNLRDLEEGDHLIDMPRRFLIIFAEALAKADKLSERCALSTLTIDNTSNSDAPVHYTLSADFRYESINQEWDISHSPYTWDELDNPDHTKVEAALDGIRSWREDSQSGHPGPHQLDLKNSQLGPNDAILVCTWLTLKHVRAQVKRLFMGHVDKDITSSSIGVRGKFQLARVLGGYTEGTGDQPSSWHHNTGPNLVETVQIDLSDRVLKLQSTQKCIPGEKWELRDLRGMDVADVCFLTGWIRNSSVRMNLKRLEVYSTGAGSWDVGEHGAVKYSLGRAYGTGDANLFNQEENLRSKNLGPADSGLLGAWLAKDDSRQELKSIDLSDNRFLFDFETTREERKELHMKPFASWTDFCESLGASEVIEIRVGDTRMSPTPARLLFNNSKKLKVLDVHGNPIAGEDPVDPAAGAGVLASNSCAVTALRELVQASQALNVLDISRCELDAAVLHELASPPEAWANSSIHTLLLDGNPLTKGTGMALASSLDPDASPQAQTETEDFHGTVAFFVALGHHGIRITELGLSDCGLGAHSADAMAEALKGAGIQECLQTLRLTGNSLGGIARDTLADGTSWWAAPPPTHTDLSDSLDNVKLALSQTHITDLDLGNCGLGPLNMKSIAQALSDADSTILPTLCRLNVVGNPLTGSFWENDPGWCCICSSRCQRKCSVCKDKVAVCGKARATRRFFCLACANARNEKRAKSIEDLRQIILVKEEADDDFKHNEAHLYARLQWDMAVWIARPIEVKAALIDATIFTGDFELNEDLSVKKLNPTSDLVGNYVLDDAGVTIGMYLNAFQGKPVKPGTQWTVLRNKIKAAGRPWAVQFSSRPPGSTDMDVKAVLDLARGDNLKLDISSSTACFATALRAQLLHWRKGLKNRSLAGKAAGVEKHFKGRERDWTDCQTKCQPWCKCRMQYDVDTRGIEALAKSLCGTPKAESYVRELDISSCHIGAFGMLAFCGAVMTKTCVSKANPHHAKEVGFFANELSWQTGQEKRAKPGAGLTLDGWAPRVLTRTENTPGVSEFLAPGVTISLEPRVQWSCFDGRPEEFEDDEDLGQSGDWGFRSAHATGRLTRLTVDSTGIVGYPQVYTLDSLDEHIDVSNKSLGPADAELLSCWLSKPDVHALAESLDLSDNPSLLGKVWNNQTPVFAERPAEQKVDENDDDEDDESFHGTLKQPDDVDGLEAFRVLCNGRRKDQPSATLRGLATTAIRELNLGNIGMGSVGCEVFCNVVREKTEFSSGIRQLLLPRNGATDTGIGVLGGRNIAHVIELPEGRGMDNLEEVVLAKNLTIPVQDKESCITALDFTTWTLREDNELRRLAYKHHDVGEIQHARERWQRIAQDFPKAGAHLLHNERWPTRGPDMLRRRFELLNTDSAVANLTAGGVVALADPSLSAPLATELARTSTSSSQMLHSTTMPDTVANDDKGASRNEQHREGSQSLRFETNDAKGIGPGEAIVLAAAIGRLDRLCTFSSQTTGLGLRVDRWQSKAYTLNAPGSSDYPRQTKDNNDNSVEAFGGDGVPVVDRLDLPGMNFGPYDLQVLTRWLFKPEVLPTLTAVNLSNNPLIGQSWRPDMHIEPFVPFIELLGNSNIKELRMANVGMGFEATMTCTQILDSREGGDVKFRMLELLDVSANPLTDTGKGLLQDVIHKRLPEQSIVLLDEGEDLSHLPAHNFDQPKPKLGKRYECRRDMPVNTGVELESKHIGFILQGAYVDALDEIIFGDAVRVRLSLDAHGIGAEGETGWVSKSTDKGIKALFQLNRDEKQREPVSETQLEPEPEIDETEPVTIVVHELMTVADVITVNNQGYDVEKTKFKTHVLHVAPSQTIGFLKGVLAESTHCRLSAEQQQLFVAEQRNGPLTLPVEDETRALAECGLSTGGEILLCGDEHDVAVGYAKADLLRGIL